MRSKGSASNAMEKGTNQLFQVVKDHKNEIVLQMCEESNKVCYATSAATSDEGESSQLISHLIHYPKLPCRIVVVNQMEYYVKMHDATINLLGNDMQLEMESLSHLTNSTPAFTSTTHFTEW